MELAGPLTRQLTVQAGCSPHLSQALLEFDFLPEPSLMGLPRVQEGTPCHHLLFGWTVEAHLLKFLLILTPETCDAHTLSLTVTLSL